MLFTPEAKIWSENIKNSLMAVDEGLASPEAVQMLLGTAARESRLGKIKTKNRKTGIGPFQIIRTTEKDIWNNYLKYKPELAKKIEDTTGVSGPSPDALENNFPYAAIMARLVYKRVPEDLPPASDVKAQAEYWKKWYNTDLGAGSPEKFMDSYEKDIGSSAGKEVPEEDTDDMASDGNAMMPETDDTVPDTLPEPEDTGIEEISEPEMIVPVDQSTQGEEPDPVDIVVADEAYTYDATENEPVTSDTKTDAAENEDNLMDMLSGVWGDVRNILSKAVDIDTADSIIDKLRYTIIPGMASDRISEVANTDEETTPSWMERVRQRVSEQKKLAGLDLKRNKFDSAMKQLGLPEERAAKWRELILEDLED